MTDKQIIIDGVDISGCEKQGETIAGITCGNGERIRLANEIITKHKLCKDNPNCAYKQLKRKEQECDELKKELAKVYEDIKLSPLCYKCDEEECLLKEIDELKTENRKLKQTLAEIKEICNSVENIESINSLYDAKLSGMYLQAHKILQKISECEAKND